MMRHLFAAVALWLLPSLGLAQGWPAVNSPIPTGRTTIGVVGQVADNTALAAASTANHPAGVWRLDYTLGAAAGPLFFTPQTGTCVANGLTNDGVVCVNSSNSNSWKAVPITAIVDDKTGNINNEGSSFGVFSKPGLTANQIATWAICDGCTDEISYDGFRSTIGDTVGSTAKLINAVSGYLVNERVGGATWQVDTIFNAIGIAAVDGAKIWGYNSILSDNKGQHLTSNATRYLQNEFDFNVTSPNTWVTGLQFAGTSFAQPALANGIAFFPLDPTGLIAKWNNAIISTDGAAVVFASIGAVAPSGTNIESQIVSFSYFDAAATSQQVTLTAYAGFLNVGGSANYGLTISDGGGTNGFNLGASALSGMSIPSKYLNFNYFNASGVQHNYNVRSDGTSLIFANSTGAAIGQYSFVGSKVLISGSLALGTPSGLVTGEIAAPKITVSGAPGAGYGKLAWVAGTTAGTCKLIAYAGTSATPSTVLDNIGAGC